MAFAKIGVPDLSGHPTACCSASPHDVEAGRRLLPLAATAADRMGAVEAFSRRIFEAVFVEGRSPLDAEACGRLAVEAGLDQTTFADMLIAPETAAAHAATVAAAHARSVFGVPSFVLDGKVSWGNGRLPILRHLLLKGRRGRA